jgi:hypothetical protein
MVGMIRAAFANHPAEMSQIGQMLVGYGELEFRLCVCLASAIGDLDTAFLTFFRARGEDARLQIADALMRRHYFAAGLGEKYNAILSAYRVCRPIRNQYAHCHWDIQKAIFLTDFDSTVRKDARETPNFTFVNVDRTLLTRQVAYFSYTYDLLICLHQAFDMITGKLEAVALNWPTVLEPPPKHNPPGPHPHHPYPKDIENQT